MKAVSAHSRFHAMPLWYLTPSTRIICRPGRWSNGSSSVLHWSLTANILHAFLFVGSCGPRVIIDVMLSPDDDLAVATAAFSLGRLILDPFPTVAHLRAAMRADDVFAVGGFA